MIRQPSSSLHRPSDRSMAVNARKVLHPTICNVSQGKLAVTPIVIRDLLLKKALIAEIKQVRSCNKPLNSSYVRKIVDNASDSMVFMKTRLKQDAKRAFNPATKRCDLKWKSTDEYYGERSYSSYSYRMTRRIRPLEIRGISKTSIDGLHPLPERPEEHVPPSSYLTRLPSRRDSLDDYSHLDSPPDSPSPLDTTRNSLPESLDSDRNQSELSGSNTWSVCTGNLTGRSSVYSWGNNDEFDKKASATVRRMFDEIDDLLFEKHNSQGADPLSVECNEWSTTFPHMRTLGKQLVPPSDNGTQVIVLNKVVERHGTLARPDTAATVISLDDVRADTLSNTFNGLTVSGQKVDPSVPPKLLRSFSIEDDMRIHPFAHLEEEIFAADGDLEEYFAYDAEFIETPEMSNDQRKSKRIKHHGYPPVTPNASASDNIISEVFDRLWEEVVQGLRELLHLYTERLTKEYPKTLLPSTIQQIRRPLDSSPVRTFSRDSSSRIPPLSSQFGMKTAPGAPSHATDNVALHELMSIRSLSLYQRDSSGSTVPPKDDENAPPFFRDQLRPISSNFNSSRALHGQLSLHHSDYQFYGKVSAKTAKRSGRLQPLQPMDRTKTPGLQENDVIGEIVRGTRLHTAGNQRLSLNSFPGFSPQIWNAKNGALPPIERLDTSDTMTTVTRDRTYSPKFRAINSNKRASSAATNESRHSSQKDKVMTLSDSRPNTTHTFWPETPVNESKRAGGPGNSSSLSTATNTTNNALEQGDTTIGVLHGISLPLGTHSHASKTVSFEDDVEELDDLVMWGHGPPLLSQQQKRRRANVR